MRGLNKLEVNAARLEDDLDNAWEVLAEPIQTVMRRYGIANPYEKLKEVTRGKTITRADIHDFIKTLDLPADVIARLLELSPQTYTGNAEQQAREI